MYGRTLGFPQALIGASIVVLSISAIESFARTSETKATPTPTPEPTRAELILQGSPAFRFRNWAGGYAPQIDLKTLFAQEQLPPPDLKALAAEWKQAGPRFEILRTHMERQQSSLRGEFDDAELRDRVRALFQISLLRFRVSPADQAATWWQTEGEVWMHTLTSIAFDESSPQGMKFVTEMRRLYGQELLGKVKGLSSASDEAKVFPHAELSRHLQTLKLIWPMDRIFLTEARKTLKPGAQLVANGLATDLQRLPLVPLSELRKVRRGGGVPGLAALDSVWSTAEIQSRKQEEDLFNELRLRVERARLEKMNSAPIVHLDELVKAELLPQIPLCHATGKVWSLTQL